jgi:hypothetical protein
MNCKLLRIITGEEVVAEVLEETDDTITVQNGLVVLPQQNSVGFMPWATVINKEKPEIVVNRNHIVYVAEVQEEVALQYDKMFGSKLDLPAQKKLIL